MIIIILIIIQQMLSMITLHSNSWGDYYCIPFYKYWTKDRIIKTQIEIQTQITWFQTQYLYSSFVWGTVLPSSQCEPPQIYHNLFMTNPRSSWVFGLDNRGSSCPGQYCDFGQEMFTTRQRVSKWGSAHENMWHLRLKHFSKSNHHKNISPGKLIYNFSQNFHVNYAEVLTLTVTDLLELLQRKC